MGVYELIENLELETDESKPDPVVEKVLRDITSYQGGPCNIYIGDTLWYFYDKRIWIPVENKEWANQPVLTYDERGEYFED